MDGDRAFGALPTVDLGWDLVTAFATQPREKPEDVNRGADMIAERLRRIGLTVTMHEPRLFLSLPGKASGYYREYTVKTPGSRDRGARRIVAGRGSTGSFATSDEYYYTDDHYETFRRILP